MRYGGWRSFCKKKWQPEITLIKYDLPMFSLDLSGFLKNLEKQH